MLSTTYDVLSASGIHPEKVRGVGIASAGVINSDSGEVVFASNLSWRNVPIGTLFGQRFGLPVRLFNDANAAAIAEWLWGAGVCTRNMIYVTVSTGVGAGIVSDGRLVSGRDGSAGGHKPNRGGGRSEGSGRGNIRKSVLRKFEQFCIILLITPLKK